MHRGIVLFVAAALTCAGLSAGCRRSPRIADATYAEAVSAFYVSLAAMQTSQDALARKELDRLTQIAPQEAAGWANLGLLLLRQQQFDEAAARLTKAAELAPGNAAIARLRGLTESRRGNLDAAIGHWRQATGLDAADLQAPYALAQELERLGGPANEAEAQRVLQGLASRSQNLAAWLDLARLSAKRGDGAQLAAAIDALTRQSAAWPGDARERLAAVQARARTSPSEATTAVIFLKNVLLREPVYRGAFAALTPARGELGEPLLRLATLANPEPRPAAPDEQLSFVTDAQPSAALGGTLWVGAIWLTGDGAPVPAAVSARELRLGGGISIPLPPAAAIEAGVDVLAAADLDYDFRTDLVAATTRGIEIFRQADNGAFRRVTPEAKLPPEIGSTPFAAVWPADVDTDGDLDLVAARRDGPVALLRNNGDGTFAVQQPFGPMARVRGFAWADVDGEGVPDAALLDDQGALRIFLNRRGGLFEERTPSAPIARIAAIAAADVSGDGILDVLAAAGDGSLVRVSVAGGTVDVARVGGGTPLAGASPGLLRLQVADLDNNAAPDVVLSAASGTRLFLGAADGYRAKDTALPAMVLASADLDGDGRLELLSSSSDGARIVRVRGATKYHYQTIRPRAMTATGDQRINSFGIGGEVEVRTGLHAQKLPIAAPVVHFGLGEASGVEVARITWPNGVLQSEFALAADSPVAATQRLKGSCPWLFAWDGAAMSFVTDFIWRSPLGLRINAQATADVQMTEDWVRIRGDQLRPRGGEYDLRITAELWETHFFDLTSLLVVDHPEGTEVFVDERFAVPAPRLGVTVTNPVQPFASARDDGGANVVEVVRARDDRNVDSAGRGRYQGITRDHFVELELPAEAPRSGPLWLVAQGWIHPTDSSINVAIGQGRHARPSGLSLHIADRHGRFQRVRDGLGFPAGKDKTVLIDLTGLFPEGGPRRLRLSTNLEIYWDRLGWAVGRPDVRIATRRLPLKSAELRFRGYSVTGQASQSVPERPRYELAGTAPRWRDLEGYHTRFGDVRELLERVDDRYVIMNAGDELRLAFPEAQTPASGTIRDFVLVGDGWVKDGDYNTVASRTVLPLPTHASPTYVAGTGRLEDDPVYRRSREDFERYHTRLVSPDGARDALRARIDRDRP